MSIQLNLFLAIIFSFLFLECHDNSNHNEEISIDKIVLDEKDPVSGYYLEVLPKNGNIDGVLVLMPGFGQLAEAIFPETDLHKVARKNNFLTIGFSGRTKLYLDDALGNKLNNVLKDVIQRHKVNPEKFIFGGFSAGGVVALRYVELCKEFPDDYPVNPRGIFVVDSPIDLFFAWEMFETYLQDSLSEIAVQEAQFVMKFMRQEHGVPRENVEVYSKLSPFSMNKEFGENEVFLKDVAVRTYHDVDIPWRIKNRNQSVKYQNYVVTSELINRLNLLGNENAEFMQSFETGYRSNGERHPHSWSIVDEEECVGWMKKLIK